MGSMMTLLITGLHGDFTAYYVDSAKTRAWEAVNGITPSPCQVDASITCWSPPPLPAGTQWKSSHCLPGQPGAPLLLHQEHPGLPHDVLRQDTNERKATQAAVASLEVNSAGPPQPPAPPRTQRWLTAGVPVPRGLLTCPSCAPQGQQG